MKKVLVTGAKGQLGRDVMDVLSRMDVIAKGVDMDDFNLCDGTAVSQAVGEFLPDAVIHCAAYVAVDKAQSDSQVCCEANVIGTYNIVKACKEIDAAILYVSTDYVFPGDGDTAYSPEDHKGPTNVYGMTKYAGELVVQSMMEKYFITRISWVFGIGGNNFIETMLRLSETRDTVTVIDDQIGSPTFTKDAAKTICDIAVSDKYGVYHVTNEGFCSWNEFAKEIFKAAGKSTQVLPTKTKDYPTPAMRPLNSRMSKDCLVEAGFDRLPTWKDALERYIKLR